MGYISLWNNRQHGVDWSSAFADLNQQLDSLFAGLPGLMDGERSRQSDSSAVSRWFESDDGYLLRIDLPGVKAKDIDLQWEDGALQLSAERVFEGAEDSQSRRRIEQSYRLPKEVDASKAKARYEDGVLNLELPKSERAKPRRIPVKG